MKTLFLIPMLFVMCANPPVPPPVSPTTDASSDQDAAKHYPATCSAAWNRINTLQCNADYVAFNAACTRIKASNEANGLKYITCVAQAPTCYAVDLCDQ